MAKVTESPLQSSARQIAADAIQRTYNDATQTVLDHRAASAVVADLRAAGWMSPQEVAAIVAAAGGNVTLQDEHLMAAWDGSYDLLVGDDFAAGPGAKTITARKRP